MLYEWEEILSAMLGRKPGEYPAKLHARCLEVDNLIRGVTPHGRLTDPQVIASIIVAWEREQLDQQVEPDKTVPLLKP